MSWDVARAAKSGRGWPESRPIWHAPLRALLRSASASRGIVQALRWLNDQPRRHRFLIYMAIDALAAVVSLLLVLVIYQARCHCVAFNATTWAVLIGFGPASVAIFRLSGLYKPLIRHRDSQLVWRVIRATVPAVALIGFFITSFAGGVNNDLLLFPLWIALFALTLSWRAAGTELFALIMPDAHPNPVRVVIYGAGQAGRQLMEMLLHERRFALIGFVDDNPELQGCTLRDFPIHAPAMLAQLTQQGAIDQIILACPSIGLGRRSEILRNLSELGVHVTTLPALADVMSGRLTITALRDVTAEELLSRDPVAPDLALIARELTGRSVLVTGAGGSIGSALCREILRHGPRKLVIFDVSEPALYHIDMEVTAWLRQNGGPTEIVSVLGSVLDRRLLNRVVREHGIEIFYHAAAYKHVPLVEANVGAGVENNVFGTLNAVQTAARHHVRKFVLISTDKAVRPTSVMGASKRLAEMVADAVARRHPGTQFALVRFGNVLDSAGSVVPLFRRQIAQGGPVTVTHPEMVRFFMTIPEAAELVIQAGAAARSEGCDVFHLDMGEPVRVLDLAHRLIALSGLTVREPGKEESGDIEIAITGIRPGEKLYEELLVDGQAAPTANPRIFRARDVRARWSEVRLCLRALRRSLREGDMYGIRSAVAESIEYPALNSDLFREVEAEADAEPTLRHGAGLPA